MLTDKHDAEMPRKKARKGEGHEIAGD